MKSVVNVKVLKRSISAWRFETQNSKDLSKCKSSDLSTTTCGSPDMPKIKLDTLCNGWNGPVVTAKKNDASWIRHAPFAAPTLPFTGFTSQDCCHYRVKHFSTHQSAAKNVGGIVEVPLAQTGEGIAECELLTWLVKEGDKIEEFQPLCEVQSDKATIQITSRYKGKVTRVNFLPGDVIKVGETLVEILTGSDEGHGGIDATSHVNNADTESILSSLSHVASNFHVEKSKGLATPAVRHLAREYGINLEDVMGSGKDGRILKEDVLKYAADKQALNEEISAVSEFTPRPPETGESVVNQIGPDIHSAKDETIYVRGYQRIMVKTMTAAAAIPHFHFMEEFNVDALVELKKSLNDICAEQGVKLTYLPFVIKSLSVALTKYPLLNSTCNEDASEICCRGAHNVGVAMATPHGLVVPNVKNIKLLSILEIAKELLRLSNLAAANKLSSEDVSGGTITISNIGAIGGKFGCPLLNVPEVAIVAIGRIQKLPRFSEDGDVYPASIMNVTFGADHRVVDGATVAKICGEWKSLVEQPERLIMHLK
eukprot:c23290_g1_i1 orf=482-2101(+)